VALGDRTYAEIAGSEAPFERRMVELKGYEGPSTAWATSFELLREFLRTRGE
jgi:hypothetical protein